jgi:hypothetical protein
MDTYESSIIFGNDFDSKRFSYDKILGQIAPPERDGSRRISDANGDFCGLILRDLSIDNSDTTCDGCSKAPLYLQKVATNAYIVISKEGDIMGTIKVRLPN